MLKISIVPNQLKSKVLKYDNGATYANANTPVIYNGKLYVNKWYVSPGTEKPDNARDTNPWILASKELQSLPGYSTQAKNDLGY